MVGFHITPKTSEDFRNMCEFLKDGSLEDSVSSIVYHDDYVTVSLTDNSTQNLKESMAALFFNIVTDMNMEYTPEVELFIS